MSAQIITQPKRLSELSSILKLFLSDLPDFYKILYPDLSIKDNPSYRLLLHAPEALLNFSEKPLIVTAFVGPSGAGKSTIFNAITGLSVPSGGAVRPMTYVSIAAFSDKNISEKSIEKLFPGFEISNYTLPDDLKNKHFPPEKLFYTCFNQDNVQSDLDCCLVDIPDFNTTEKSNWERAEQMISRADTVIFTVYHEAYKNSKTFEILKRCCRYSGNLIYLLTKLDIENPQIAAQEIYEDLLESASRDPEFAEKRADGKSIFEFLSNRNFYYSPQAKQTGIENIIPIKSDYPSFYSTLYGENAYEIVLNRQLQILFENRTFANNLLLEAKSLTQSLNKDISMVQSQVTQCSQKIVGEEFPVFFILEMIKKLLSENRPGFLKRLLTPFNYLTDTMTGAVKSVKRKLLGLKSAPKDGEIELRNDLEQKRLIKFSEELVEEWRINFQNERLNAEICRQTMQQFVENPLPAVDDQWEMYVRDKLTNWLNTNKNRWIWLNVINDLSLILGSSLFMLDFVFEGGIGSLGLVAVVGGSGVLGGFLMSLFNNMGLGKEILEAHKKWKEIRSQDYCAHLLKNLASPLFYEKFQTKEKQINSLPIQDFENAILTLDKAFKSHVQDKN